MLRRLSSTVRFYRRYKRQIDDLDVIVNNAGFATLGYFADVPVEKSLEMLNVHLTATIQFTHAAIQALCPGFTHTEFHEVGDLRNYDRKAIPDSMLMSPDKVVSLSLKALGKSKKTIFIPGWRKRLSKWINMNSSVIRKVLVDKANNNINYQTFRNH